MAKTSAPGSLVWYPGLFHCLFEAIVAPNRAFPLPFPDKKCRAHSSAEGEESSTGADVLCVYASCQEHAGEGYIQRMHSSYPAELSPILQSYLLPCAAIFYPTELTPALRSCNLLLDQSTHPCVQLGELGCIKPRLKALPTRPKALRYKNAHGLITQRIPGCLRVYG